MKVGIDLGTAYSVVARYGGSQEGVSVVTNEDGVLLTPTVVCAMKDTVFTGRRAAELMVGGASGCAVDFKKHVADGTGYVSADGSRFSAADAVREMYRHLAEAAESSAGERIEGAVITVPAYFDDVQRRAVIDAAEAAGLSVIRVLNEPTAAAVYYGCRKGRDRTMLIYDFGGGTTDITLCRINGGNIEILGAAGNNDIGGNKWDDLLLTYVSDAFAEANGMSPADDPRAREELLQRAEAYKRLLSAKDSVDFEISYNGIEFSQMVTRRQLEEMGRPLLESAFDLIMGLGSDESPFDPQSVDEVLLTGGASRMPCVKAFLESKGFRNVVAPSQSDADTAVARGAALAIGMSEHAETRSSRARDVSTHSLGFITEAPDGSAYVNTIIIPRFTPLPAHGQGRLHLGENNTSDRIEVYLVQGESTDPQECTVLGKCTVKGFDNPGTGVTVDALMSYDENGIVSISAELAGRKLIIENEPGYGDTSWMSRPPSQRELDRSVDKEIAYCIDFSKSMWDQLDSVRECVLSSSGILNGPNTTFTLIGFADKQDVLCGPGADRETMLSCLAQVRLGFRGLGRGTAAEPFGLLNSVLGDYQGARFAAVITDGSWESRDDAVEMAAVCRRNNIVIYAFGIGKRVDRSFLRQIAAMDGAALRQDTEGLKLVTDTIAVAIRDGQTGLREALR